jgi:hypothetical protein
MMAKASENSFDGGRTSRWMTELEETNKASWIGVRFSNHTIYILSDRSRTGLTRDIEKGFRLMSWLTKQPLTWYWWDQDWKRVLPANTDPGPDHINGGWAIPGVPEVHVYRREEAHKVLLHECIHALLLDVRGVQPVLKQFESELGRQLYPHIGEAYTELFAEFLWSIAEAKSIKDARLRWTGQLQCSERTAAIVWKRIHDAKEAEATNVFAYYILKWVLMQHEEVLLGPNHSLTSWFRWFQDARSRLDALAASVSASEHEEQNMSMTCV